MKRFLSALMLIFALFAASCDSSVRRIVADTLITGEQFELKIKFDKAITGGDFITFTTDLTLDEIKTSVDKTKKSGVTLSSEIYQGDYLLIDYTAGGKLDYFIIAAIDGATAPKLRYYIAAPYASVGEGYAAILVPHHLFVYDRNVDSILGFEAETENEITGTKQDFLDFYGKISLYTLTDEDSRINIKIKADGQIAGRHSRDGFSIEFSSDGNTTYAKYIAV